MTRAGAALAGLATVLVSVSATLGSGDGEGDVLAQRRVQAAETVEMARNYVTFPFAEPTWLPAGYSLEHAAFFSPNEEMGTTASSIDLWYSAPGLPFIHVWQSDIPDLGDKDPVGRGEPTEVDGSGSWFVVLDARGVDSDAISIFSKRLPSGVTVSIDSGIPVETLTRFVQGLDAK